MRSARRPTSPRGWYVRIRDPRTAKVTAAELYLKDESLSTSGSYEKFFEIDGKTYSHIMDPRTGRSAEGVASVSVLAKHPLDSEAWTKAFFVNVSEVVGEPRTRRLPSLPVYNGRPVCLDRRGRPLMCGASLQLETVATSAQ